jgi:hypothetical protein
LLLVAASIVTFSGVIEFGGASVASRVLSLVDTPVGELYYRNRGRFLEYTVRELVPEYPLGAGLGRWGMTNSYFGDNSDPDRAAIWVEIQWTGWLLDGGIPLIVAYLAVLGLTFRYAWRLAWVGGSAGRDEIWFWSALVVGYNVGALALTFSYPVFMSQQGLELWLLNGALFAAARTSASLRPTRS